MADEHPPDSVMRRSMSAFLAMEHGIHIVLGVLLSAAALIALFSACAILVEGLGDWQSGQSLLRLMDRLLFVLMLAEILHTVRVSIRSGALHGEPFLIVGLIASIRRVLVITLESSQGDQAAEQFQSSMIELAVLAGMILVMSVSIYVLRKASAIEPRDVPDTG